MTHHPPDQAMTPARARALLTLRKHGALHLRDGIWITAGAKTLRVMGLTVANLMRQGFVVADVPSPGRRGVASLSLRGIERAAQIAADNARAIEPAQICAPSEA